MHFHLLASLLILTQPSADRVDVLVVVGAAGTAEYAAEFAQWAERWSTAAAAGQAGLLQIGSEPEGDLPDRDLLRGALDDRIRLETTEPLWLVLIGHGTFDGREARFNLRGPDIGAAELAQWLEPARRPVAVINCASCSGPFINRLSAAGRIVVTATKSGQERSFTRFGDYLSSAISDLAADLDKDRQVSLLEAFLYASLRVGEFYEREARLSTEHALLDDNGDGLGTRAEWFRGVRAVQAAKDGAELDGLRANQLHLVRNEHERQLPPEIRARRDQLEADLEQLRRRKPQVSEGQYDRQLEPLLIELAELYERVGDWAAMRVIPVIDLKDGIVVRGIAGQRQQYQSVHSVLAADPRPLTIATAFRDAGFDTVYVADLDAIGGAAPNWSALQQIAARGLNILLDAGVNSIGRACQLAAYAEDQPRLSAIIFGLESVGTVESLRECLLAVGPQRSIFSLDLRHGRPITSCAAWQHRTAPQIAAEAISLGLQRLIVLDLARVGTGQGLSILELCGRLHAEHPEVQLIAGGGVRHREDLRNLQAAGCTAALVASALHDGTLKPLELMDPDSVGAY